MLSLTFLQDCSQCTWMFKGNTWKTLKHYLAMGEALQDYNLISILMKQVDCCKQMFKEIKKMET